MVIITSTIIGNDILQRSTMHVLHIHGNMPIYGSVPKRRVVRQTGPARCLVLALCVLRTMSVFVCLCSSVVGGWRVSVFSVSASVGPWVRAPAFVRVVLSLIVLVASL